MEKNADKIRDLCTRIIAETDPDTLAKLNKELDAVLDEREEKLRKLPRGTNS